MVSFYIFLKTLRNMKFWVLFYFFYLTGRMKYTLWLIRGPESARLCAFANFTLCVTCGFFLFFVRYCVLDWFYMCHYNWSDMCTAYCAQTRSWRSQTRFWRSFKGAIIYGSRLKKFNFFFNFIWPKLFLTFTCQFLFYFINF